MMRKYSLKKNQKSSKEKQKCLLLCGGLTFYFYVCPGGDEKDKKSFKLSCLRVRMSYLRFYDLAEFLTETSPQKSAGESFPNI